MTRSTLSIDGRGVGSEIEQVVDNIGIAGTGIFMAHPVIRAMLLFLVTVNQQNVYF